MRQRKLNKDGDVNADPYALDKEGWRLGYLSPSGLNLQYQDTLLPTYIQVARRRKNIIYAGLTVSEDLVIEDDED